MSEITQIVRRQRRDEILPVYSTDQLLMQMRVVAPKKQVLKIKRKEKRILFAEKYELIKEMLGRFALNSEIAEAVGVPDRYLKEHIRSTKELVLLSDARFVEVKRRGGKVGIKKSRDKFAKEKSKILKALETEPMYKIAAQFGFSQKTLKIYVDEVKNGK